MKEKIFSHRGEVAALALIITVIIFYPMEESGEGRGAATRGIQAGRLVVATVHG